MGSLKGLHPFNGAGAEEAVALHRNVLFSEEPLQRTYFTGEIRRCVGVAIAKAQIGCVIGHGSFGEDRDAINLSLIAISRSVIFFGVRRGPPPLAGAGTPWHAVATTWHRWRGVDCESKGLSVDGP